MATKSATIQILLHHLELSLFESLLSIELLKLRLETPFMLPNSFIIHPLFL